MKYRNPQTGELEDLQVGPLVENNLDSESEINALAAKQGKILNEKIEQLEEAKDVYSTNEVKTNKVWVDGKSIYRKYFNSNITVNSITLTNTSNIDDIVFSGGYILRDNVKYEFGKSASISTGSYETESRLLCINNNLRVDLGDAWINGTLKIFVEYTKTTD